ncbi:ABC transporter permease [Paenibacillus zanthoxyli]|uniref:ABC transporter permease n=1 Tax=Paenibacillus zanthoxyli TaxID=369399 RepID=UPI000471EEBB|nr:ABC transporter permease [Paenibacillus zanthoxyli]
MRIRELGFYLRKHKWFNLFIYVQATLFLMTAGTFVVFWQQLEYESGSLGQIYENKVIRQLLDGYYEGDKYSEFINRPDSLQRLKAYYSGLNTTDDFDYLAMFNHYILLQDEDIPATSVNGYEQGSPKHQETIDGTRFAAVKSFQMNRQAFEFFGVKISKGRGWNEEDFSRSTGTMPVLLGSSYQATYKVGDMTTINYYNSTIRVEVIGFVTENSKVFYSGSPEFYLDDYVILPYRDYRNPVSDEERKFQQIVYFAMINGFVVTDNEPAAVQTAMQRVESIAKKAEIGGYSFIGLNPHFQKYRGLLTVLQQNASLVRFIFIVTTIINALVLAIALTLQQHRRFTYWGVHYLQGANPSSLMTMLWTEIGVVMLTACATSYWLLNRVLVLGSPGSNALLLALSLGISAIVMLFPARQLRRGSSVAWMNKESEGEY